VIVGVNVLVGVTVGVGVLVAVTVGVGVGPIILKRMKLSGPYHS
jgi:Mg/Co/Ni transporter MgtE